MRKFAKISAVLAAMVLALAFVGCKDDDDDDDPSVITTWYCTEEDDGSVVTETVYFYDDSTFKVVESSEGVNITFATGTYTGDTTKDGNVVITIKKVVKGMLEDSESLELVDVPSEYASEFIWKATISGNTMTTADGDGELSAWLKK
ncbi:hypothetical protein [uncultured Treponema sp.]|uniref:hypothetical protein n=1 Tax=uncultured Treponema sp. TaxID=162155 RepID=UPI0025E8CFBA|nr:hypothetical protein [uncultured Treponema sp.]